VIIENPRTAWKAQPWKNGRGVTHEIWRTPAGDGDADYDVRVSLADVTESGPFSTFPGYRRWTFLVGPAPISLGPVDLLAPGDHVELPGAQSISAELRAGATTLLNVLARSSVAIVCGVGPVAHPIRFAFELAARRAHLLDPPAAFDTAGQVWLAITARA
jgi:environmental stress-induced protein Ves